MPSRNAWHFFVDSDRERAYNNSMMNDMTEDQLMAALYIEKVLNLNKK